MGVLRPGEDESENDEQPQGERGEGEVCLFRGGEVLPAWEWVVDVWVVFAHTCVMPLVGCNYDHSEP